MSSPEALQKMTCDLIIQGVETIKSHVYGELAVAAVFSLSGISRNLGNPGRTFGTDATYPDLAPAQQFAIQPVSIPSFATFRPSPHFQPSLLRNPDAGLKGCSSTVVSAMVPSAMVTPCCRIQRVVRRERRYRGN